MLKIWSWLKDRCFETEYGYFLVSVVPFVHCVFVYVCWAEVPGVPQSNSTCSTHLSPAFLTLTLVLTHRGLFISHLARLTAPPPTQHISNEGCDRGRWGEGGRWEPYLLHIYSISMNYREVRSADKGGMVLCLLVVFGRLSLFTMLHNLFAPLPAWHQPVHLFVCLPPGSCLLLPTAST